MSRQGRGFDSQLEYLSELANQYNVILVDDASTDGSWERILELSPRLNPKLHLMRMERNGKKVQAIRRAVGTSDADYVLMTDFDSRISNPEAIPLALQKFEENPRLAALSLKLVPEGTTFFSKFQDVEYAISRGIFARYLNGQGSLRCVPGAAGIWDRKVFLKVLKEHSGRHNGDDLESTAIALRRGYDAEYAGDVVVTTIVPQTPAALFAQRRRWELGSLETYDKERSFFSGQVRNLTSRLGHITILDWYAWMTTIMLPVLIINWVINPIVASAYVLFELSLVSVLSYVARDELKNKRELILVPFFPFYRVLSTIPRIAAAFGYITGVRSQTKPPMPLYLNRFPAVQHSPSSQMAMPLEQVCRTLMVQPTSGPH